ncbi:hypothetical protein H4Q32_024888 [Labeo rohita]|uniref:Neural cell adhesion molecule L1 n=1 Tax=Labeo rohita TaxID=84645 RepID=A0ABQ8KZH8_LABRO|nr:hypothetical protein H4Q32_024888 [Labeo rohita]
MAQPVSHTAFSLDDVNLACEADGDPTPSFRWVKDGKQFRDVLLESGTLTADDKEELRFYQGSYRCYVANELGTAVSDLVHLITEPIPTLAKEKRQKKRSFEEGQSAVLYCNPPKSSVAPKIHWMDMQLRHIPLNERVTTSLDGNLYFANLLVSDSREDYTCNAYYINASVILPKDPIAISVTPSNSVVKNRQPKLQKPAGSHSSYLVLRGQTLTLECIPEGLPTPEVHWERMDSALSPTRAKKLNHDRWLQIKSVSEADDGDYTHQAISSIHSPHISSVLIKMCFCLDAARCHTAPYWTKWPEDHLYAPGETVRLDCQAEGIPTPNITWSINGVPIAGTDLDPRRHVSSGTLILTDVQYSDTAIYQCEATNKHGNILVNTRVHVAELPPQILTEDGIVYKATEGQTAVLQCRTKISDSDSVLANARMSQTADGNLKISNVSEEDTNIYTCSVKGSNNSISAELEVLMDHKLKQPTIQWKKDKQKIRSSAYDDKYTDYPDGSLKITDAQIEDTGIYSCEISTKLDSVGATGSITVQDKPDSPQSLELSEKEQRSVTLSWMPGPENNSPVSEYVIEMKEEQIPEKGQWEEYSRVPQDIRRLQIHLQPYSTYRFQVRAVNDIGTSGPSPPSESHTTAPAKPDVNPENVSTELERRQFNGPGFKYKVYWRQASHRDSVWKESSVSNPPFVVNETGTFVPFEIKVQALNELGAGPEPDAEIGHSGEDIPLEAPSEVRVTELNKTAVMIHLRKKDPRTQRSTEYSNKNRVIEVHGNKVEAVVSDLQFYSTYTLTIAPFNSRGEGPHSEVYHFTTPEGPPGPISLLTFDSPSETEITLFWEAPDKPNGVLTGYLLQHHEIEPGISSPQQVESIDLPLVTKFTLKGLNPQSLYRFELRARNAAGDGEPIVTEAATLLNGEPPSVINITSGQTSVNFTWVPGERQRNCAFRFRYLKKSAGSEWEESEKVNSTQAFYQLQGLTPGVHYHLQILPGNSSWHFETAGPELHELPSSFATQGWFIGLISAIVLLLLVLLILCYIKKSKGGKYSVKDKEEDQVNAGARPMKEDAFGEYRTCQELHLLCVFFSDNEKCSISQQSVCESKRSSNDSLADYGDSVDIQFNEDGSFIGQYSGRRDPSGHGAHGSSGAASPVNPNMPPPSISFPTSVTGFLGPN